jgi:hypothetical protein
MRLIRPFTMTDAALLSSSIGESGAVALEGDMTDGDDAEALEGDESGLLLFEGDEAGKLEWDAATPYALGDQVIVTAANYHHAFESLSGGTSHTVTITIASPGVVSWTAHGLAAGTPITFSTTGALPTGLVAGTVYYVVTLDADSFKVSATAGGSAINTSGTQSGTHTATANPNIGMAPRDHPEFWLDRGASNRWAMFDQYNTSQSTAPSEIEVEIEPTGRINIIALLNISAASVQIVAEDEVDGEIFNQTYSMVSTAGITDWYAYFFEEIIRKGDLVVELPPYVAPTVTVTFTDAGETVKVGTLILGQVKNIGGTVYGATVGITDYSRKDTDDFGNYTIVERAFSKRGEFKVWCDTNLYDEIQRVLALYRATPIVFLGTDEFACSQIYGFYKSFDLEFTGPNKSYCSLEIEGLT